MRTFIAIELPPETRGFLTLLQRHLKMVQADVKWAEAANLHLTLRFLGERDEKQLRKINSAILATARANKPFRISLGTAGAFPDLDSPRIIWVGIKEGLRELKTLVASLEEKLAIAGLPKEKRPFSSHITIGRTRSPDNLQELVSVLKDTGDFLAKQKLDLSVDTITLFKSTLTTGGPLYHKLTGAALATT